jgi:hypothetical protein
VRRDGDVGAGDLARRDPEERRELALLAGRDERVLDGHDDRARHAEPGEPRAPVVAPELAARLGDVTRVAAGHLGRRPRRAGLVRQPDRAQAGAPCGVGKEPELEAQEPHEPPAALHVRLLPVRRGRAEHEAGDEVGMVAGQEAGDRAAHRVADGHGAIDPFVAQEGRGVVGAVGEAERLGRSQPAAVAAVIEREHAIAGAGERVVRRDPVEVGRHHPAVQEQERRAVAAGVAQEELAAARHVDEAAGRRLERRLGDVARGPAPAQQRGQRARPPALGGPRTRLERRHFA